MIIPSEFFNQLNTNYNQHLVTKPFITINKWKPYIGIYKNYNFPKSKS